MGQCKDDDRFRQARPVEDRALASPAHFATRHTRQQCARRLRGAWHAGVEEPTDGLVRHLGRLETTSLVVHSPHEQDVVPSLERQLAVPYTRVLVSKVAQEGAKLFDLSPRGARPSEVGEREDAARQHRKRQAASERDVDDVISGFIRM